MSHVKTETRDFPLFKKFRASALREAKACGNATIASEVVNVVEKGEELDDWAKLAGGGFEDAAVNKCFKPGMDVARLKKLSEAI